MSMHYSASTGGFYDTNVADYDLPADAVEITTDERAAVLAGQAAGKTIAADDAGRPVAVTPPPPIPTVADVKAEARRRLAATDWYAIRKADTGQPMPDGVATYRAAVRAASSDIEALSPLPADYAADARWPVAPTES